MLCFLNNRTEDFIAVSGRTYLPVIHPFVYPDVWPDLALDVYQLYSIPGDSRGYVQFDPGTGAVSLITLFRDIGTGLPVFPKGLYLFRRGYLDP